MSEYFRDRWQGVGAIAAAAPAPRSAPAPTVGGMFDPKDDPILRRAMQGRRVGRQTRADRNVYVQRQRGSRPPVLMSGRRPGAPPLGAVDTGKNTRPKLPVRPTDNIGGSPKPPPRPPVVVVPADRRWLLNLSPIEQVAQPVVVMPPIKQPDPLPVPPPPRPVEPVPPVIIDPVRGGGQSAPPSSGTVTGGGTVVVGGGGGSSGGGGFFDPNPLPPLTIDPESYPVSTTPPFIPPSSSRFPIVLVGLGALAIYLIARRSS